jgi:beta-galactosidase
MTRISRKARKGKQSTQRIVAVFVFLCALCVNLRHANAQRVRNVIDFNRDWKFSLINDSNALQPTYNDAQWRSLHLPHDWSIEGQFSALHPATTQGGALPGGIGWYRKTFNLPVNSKDKLVSIEFDGIYRNSEVWINGHYLGKRPNGYISFSYDLTPYLLHGKKDVIAVRVDNSQQPNSRWYSGSGIYRNVRLVVTDKISIPQWGADIRPKVVNPNLAIIYLRTMVQNKSLQKETIRVEHALYDDKGKLAASATPYTFPLDTFGSTAVQEMHVRKFRLWSVDTPVLYKLVTRIIQKGKLIDQYETKLGFRSFYFDAGKGFFLNNKPLKIQGVCMHHDLGALGAAISIRAMERQLEILKAMGCNAIRTAHNPPAPELLDLCDRMGFLVMDEAFDMWRKKKNKFDYFSDFDQWHKQDMEDMVKRDRNHPSVFMWSIGNEIREQFDSSGISITRELVRIVKDLDDTRPVTAGLSEWNPEKNFMYKAGALDIVGLNYHHEVYKDFPTYYPGQKFLGAENMSALATRGHYDFPSDTLVHWPERSPQRYVTKGNPDYTVSAYDQVSAYWGSTHEETWRIIKNHDYLSGLFVWTGFDYLGEPTPYPWPARSSYFCIVDLAGFPKDVYYLYQSEWTRKPVLHIFPHWNWSSGQLIDVWAYYNNADEIELFLNGRSLGIKKKQDDQLHIMWRIPFEKGEVKAVSRKNGRKVLEKIIRTADKAARIELIADRKIINADGKDLSFITARVLDKNGNLVPDADHLLRFTVSGAGIIAATDNGYQADTSSFQSHERACWKGMALAIVRSSGKQGNITLRATADGLQPAFLTLKAGNYKLK